MSAYALLDIAGGLFGPPALGLLMCAPLAWREPAWFLTWWTIAALWVVAGCALLRDTVGMDSAALSLAAALTAVLVFRLRRRGQRRAG